MNGYYPYQMGGIPAMQNRLAQLEQRPYAPMMVPLKGRVVTGLDEARAAQIDFDGSVSYFPSPAEGKIYAKSIDLNGMPSFLTYTLQTTPAPQESAPQGHTLGLEVLDKRLQEVEKVLKELGYEPNANSSTDTK